MSEFTRKTLAGRSVTGADWKAHLLAAHKKSPGMSPPVFESCHDAQGRNSYQRLAASLMEFRSAATVVDLACGDGALIPYCRRMLPIGSRMRGVDMSPAEIARAKAVVRGEEFIVGHAESLPFADSSADAVLCHMALMLMAPLAPVILEIRRVLRPSGFFAATYIQSPPRSGALEELMSEAAAAVKSEFPGFIHRRPIEARLHSVRGLRELFVTKAGFHTVESIEDDSFERAVSPAGAWEMVKDMYLIGMLPAATRNRLKERLIARAGKLANRGRLRMSFACRTIKVRRS